MARPLRFEYLGAMHPVINCGIYSDWLCDACRKKGFTIRSIIDCLIASLALEYELAVLEKDKDYSFISKVFPLKNAIGN